MSDLVQIPWQPVYWLLPEMVAKLRAAGDRLGTNLMLYTGDSRGLLSAWRSYPQQRLLYLAAQAGGNVASNPDTGPRSHMRGTAADIVRTDAAAQNACRAVGLIRDPSETWHWNLPGYLNYPIIPTNTAAAGGGGTLIQEEPVFTVFAVKNVANDYTLLGSAGKVRRVSLATVNLLAGQKLFTPAATKVFNTQAELEAALAAFPVVGASGVDPTVVSAAIASAFADVTIPTPTITDADKQAIINGTVAKLGATIANG